MLDAEKLEEEIKALTKKYKVQICYVSSVIEKDGSETISFCGNMCFVCAHEALGKHIKNNGIEHDSITVH